MINTKDLLHDLQTQKNNTEEYIKQYEHILQYAERLTKKEYKRIKELKKFKENEVTILHNLIFKIDFHYNNYELKYQPIIIKA